MNQSLEIFWLANSARTFQGKPDAKYGVAISAGGRHVFVKHAPPDSNPQGATLVAAERHLLKTLASQGLPIPTLVEHAASDPDTLITEYCGVSLASLLGASAGQPELTNAELGRIFSGCLRSAASLATAGVLPLDVAGGNIVVATKAGVMGGHLLLDRVYFVDHPMTMIKNGNQRRPAWLHPAMPRVAPELRAGLEEDHNEMRQSFASAGLKMGSLEQMTQREFDLLRRLYAQFNAPQVLQGALNAGYVDPDRALQYSIGRELDRFVTLRSLDGTAQAVVARLLAVDPNERFASLSEAAKQWEQAMSIAASPTSDAIWPDCRADVLPSKKDSSNVVPSADPGDGTFLPGQVWASQGTTNATSSPLAKAQTNRLQAPWLEAGVARIVALSLRLGLVAAVSLILVKSGAWANWVAPAFSVLTRFAI